MFLNMTPRHLCDRLRCRTETKMIKDKNEFVFVKKAPQHPCDRLKQITVKIDIDSMEINFVHKHNFVRAVHQKRSEGQIN